MDIDLNRCTDGLCSAGGLGTTAISGSSARGMARLDGGAVMSTTTSSGRMQMDSCELGCDSVLCAALSCDSVRTPGSVCEWITSGSACSCVEPRSMAGMGMMLENVTTRRRGFDGESSSNWLMCDATEGEADKPPFGRTGDNS